MFKTVGALYRKQFQNPKVEDDEGKLAVSPYDILKLTTEFFKRRFRKTSIEETCHCSYAQKTVNMIQKSSEAEN